MNQTKSKLKYKLIGSANTLEHLGDLISKNWHWTDFSFIQQTANTWTVQSNDEPIEGVRVKFKAKRFRFERVINE